MGPSTFLKLQRSAALNFLKRWKKVATNSTANAMPNVTGDERRVSYVTSETKRQFIEWHYSQSPSMPKNPEADAFCMQDDDQCFETTMELFRASKRNNK